MQQNKILSFIIPIVAVVIIFESVMLVSNLNNNKVTTVVPTKSVTATPVPIANAFDLAFVTPSQEMKVGKTYTVELNMLSKNVYKLDSASLYIKYDSKMATVSNLVPSTKLEKPAFIKNSTTTEMLVVNYLISDAKGWQLNQNQTETLLKFTVKPKVSGVMEFVIATGQYDRNSVTMFVENATAKVLPFSSNKLIVNVIK